VTCSRKRTTQAVSSAMCCQPGGVCNPHRGDGGMRQAGLDAGHAAGQHAAQAVGVEAGAEHRVQLVLQGGRDLVAAQVGARCAGTRDPQSRPFSNKLVSL